MKRNTPVQLLKLLSDEEIRKLSKFLRSPYFNYNQALVNLFEQLRKWHPHYAAEKIKPQKLWKKVYGTKEFSEQKYWKLNFYLRLQIERFITVEELEKDELSSRKLLLKSHSRRNAHHLFEKETKSLVRKISEQPLQDIISYSNTFWLKHHYFYNPQTDKYGSAAFSVEDAMNDLDRFYVLAKLQFATELKNRERIFSKQIPLYLLEPVIKHSEEYQDENPAFLMYRNLLDLFNPEKSETAFQAGKQFLRNQISNISKNDQNEVLLHLRNYAIRQLNKGRNNYFKDLLDLYKIGLSLDLIVDNNTISEAAFGNIVKVGCATREFEWTEQFIEDYEEYLDEEVRQDAKTMSLGILNFQNKDYSKAIELLGQYQFSRILHQMEAKILIIKTWFELFLKDKSIYELLIARLGADQKFFRRNDTVAQQKKEEHINFVLAIRQLADLIIQQKKSSVIKERISRYLKSEKFVVSKKWLLEKVEELK